MVRLNATERPIEGSPLRLSALHRALVANAASLVGTTAATAGLGLVYWVLAARQFPSLSVGLGSASISAMLLLGTLPVLGLQTLLIGELHRRPGQEAPLIATALLAAGTSGAAFGLIFAGVASHLAPGLRPLGENVGTILLFATGVSLTAITLVVDQALVGLLRGDVQLGRNVLFAAAKLLALLAAGLWVRDRFGLTIFGTWVVGNIVSLVGLGVLAALKGQLTLAARPRWKLLQGLGRAAVDHQMLNLAIQFPPLVLPLVVTIVLSATMNAYFYTAWMMAGLVFIGPEALGIVLYAVGARVSSGLVHTLRLTLGLSLLVALIATAVVLAFADELLSVFGHSYSAQAAVVLRILVLGVFPLVLKQHYVAIARIRRRPADALLLLAVGALFEVGLAAIGARIGGLTGLSLGWVAGVGVVAILVGPSVIRVAALRQVTQVRGWPSATYSAGIEN
jgi:O-antigen/teichoic acid export membrane protein